LGCAGRGRKQKVEEPSVRVSESKDKIITQAKLQEMGWSKL